MFCGCRWRADLVLRTMVIRGLLEALSPSEREFACDRLDVFVVGRMEFVGEVHPFF